MDDFQPQNEPDLAPKTPRLHAEFTHAARESEGKLFRVKTACGSEYFCRATSASKAANAALDSLITVSRISDAEAVQLCLEILPKGGTE